MAIHFDKIPEDQFERIMEVIKASINGMTQAIEVEGYCPSCFCHLVAAVAKQTADDYATDELPGSVKPNVEGDSDVTH